MMLANSVAIAILALAVLYLLFWVREINRRLTTSNDKDRREEHFG